LAWLQFSLDVHGDQAEAVSIALDAAGAMSVSIIDAADQSLLEPAPGETPLWESSRIVGLFAPGTDVLTLQKTLQEQLVMPALQLRVGHLEDRDWSNTWRKNFRAMRFGQRLWVCPSGEEPGQPDAVIVQLDPGLAFGTGTHATTAMCLEWLDTHPPVGLSVMDYGCGSGILAIAAHKLGASRVIAVDIDPQALRATRENADRNGIENGIMALLPGGVDAGPVDIMLANILANPLIEYADRLAGLVCQGGYIVLTGILAGQGVEVMAAYRHWFDFSPVVIREEWVLLEGIRK